MKRAARVTLFIAIAFFTLPAFAQVGGNGVSKASANTLGYLQFFAPPPSVNLLSTSSVCRNWPLPSFGQATTLGGGYAVLYDAGGHPHYILAC